MANENECPVCFGPCAKLSVTCCNGHAVCEKHYLQRYKAIYEEGRTAFHDDNAQCCFMCRSNIQDSSFSKPYFDLLEIVIAQGVLKRAGITDKDIFHEHLRRMRTLEEDEEDVAYKCCRDCDYTWDTKAAWDAGKGRVAFSYPAEDIEDGDVVCSLCYKGEEEYFPSDDED
jgi:hypothetical protein